MKVAHTSRKGPGMIIVRSSLEIRIHSSVIFCNAQSLEYEFAWSLALKYSPKISSVSVNQLRSLKRGESIPDWRCSFSMERIFRLQKRKTATRSGNAPGESCFTVLHVALFHDQSSKYFALTMYSYAQEVNFGPKFVWNW